MFYATKFDPFYVGACPPGPMLFRPFRSGCWPHGRFVPACSSRCSPCGSCCAPCGPCGGGCCSTSPCGW